MNKLKLSGKRMAIFTYSLGHLLPKERTRFYYSLNGRSSPGVLSRTGSLHIGRSVLIVDEEHVEEIKEFFKLWNCRFKLLNVIIDD